MTKNQIHEWHERDEESGRRRYIRGYWNSRDWTFATFEPGADDWARVTNPSPELWLSLRDVLWRKYQRKRIPFKFIQRVDAVLEDLGVPVPQHGGPEIREDDD